MFKAVSGITRVCMYLLHSIIYIILHGVKNRKNILHSQNVSNINIIQ